ncbi:MAG: class I SAM-dependent methyltransferase [Prolixibacteraceae bacterium]|nr:class I SAM-dependent methyltransferase [Prolixibacteraceae bacterium]
MATTKSTVEEIRTKFDRLAHRYTNLEKGQDTALDSPLSLELISQAAAAYNPNAKALLDIGCGGGNYIVKVTSRLPDVNVWLSDLSQNMLDVAAERVQKIISGNVTKMQGDFRDIDFGTEQYDIITAATTLHHLRSEPEWELVFFKLYKALKPGGSFWISDVIIHEHPEIDRLMRQGWFNWIEATQGAEKRVWAKEQYEKEDTPQTLNFQLNLMKKAGFKETVVLHKHLNFAAFGGIK